MAAFPQREATMSHTHAIPPEATGSPDPTDLAARLGVFRGEIDQLDDSLHDLLVRRASVVEQVASLARAGKIPFRPGREAAIIRRLLSRHTGHLPRRAIVRLWREMFAASIAMEAALRVLACEPDGLTDCVALAREHFGALTPLSVSRSPEQALAEIRTGQATVAVLRLPAEGEPEGAAWWTALLRQDAPRLHVVARLPFWQAPRPEGAPPGHALVVTREAADASGDDRTLIGVTLGPSTRGQLALALAQAGLPQAGLVSRHDPAGADAGHALIDVAGYLAADEPAPLGLPGARVLGHYAVPLAESPS